MQGRHPVYDVRVDRFAEEGSEEGVRLERKFYVKEIIWVNDWQQLQS